MILLAVAAGATLRTSQTDAQQATEQVERVEADLKILALAQSIRTEQTAGLDGNQEELIQARERTDLSFEEAIESTRQSRFLIERMRTEVNRIRTGLGDDAVSILLTTVREQAADSNVVTPTLQLQDDFTELATRPLALIEGSTDTYKTGRTATQVSTLTALVKWEDAILAERGLVNVLLGQGEPTNEQQRRLLELAVVAEEAQETALSTGLDGFDMSEAVDLPANEALYDYRERLRKVDPVFIATVIRSQVTADSDLLLEAIKTEQEILIEQIDEENAQALTAATQQQRNILLAALLVIVGTGIILFTLYRAITTPITQLSNRGRKVSNEDLPTLVRKIRSGEAKAGEQEIIPLESQTDDEIGELVNVFNDLQSTAVSMAAEQAQSRQYAAEMFVNLGRRNQRILDTVLRDLDVLEHDEEDPNRLSQLYVVDQKVTRMRRNAESLLVLAGTQTPRQWAQPAQLGDVVRAAMSEVENFERVESTVDNTVEVPGNAVADLTHLLAELIENALRFSPPEESVLVHSEEVDGQTHVYVTDSGFGMKDDKLEAANRQIEQAASSEETPSKHLGLYVVGRLATRHGILVTLNSKESGTGLNAEVNLSGLTKTLSSAGSDDADESSEEETIETTQETSIDDTVEESPEPVPAPTPPETVQTASGRDDKMPEIEPAVPLSEEVSSHAERASQAPTPSVEDRQAPTGEDHVEPKPTSRAQPNFEEMSKPRPPKRRVPGASLPENLKKPESSPPTTDEPDSTSFDAEKVRDAFSGFQKSASSTSSTAATAPAAPATPAPETAPAEQKPALKKRKPSTTPSAPQTERRGQPDFAEMTKPRAPKRRVPGASLPENLKKPMAEATHVAATTSRPEDVRDAFSGFQKSASKTSTTSDETESNES